MGCNLTEHFERTKGPVNADLISRSSKHNTYKIWKFKVKK